MLDNLDTHIDNLASHQNLRTIFRDARRNVTDFSGMGLVFCSSEKIIPHVPMFAQRAQNFEQDICEFLVNSSRLSNSCHDGFHILSESWQLLACGVFLSPPLPSQRLSNPNGYGSRWITAALTSKQAGVLGCVTISRKLNEITIFVNGETRIVDPFDE